MNVRIYHVSIGLESRFNLFTPPWAYTSVFEDWRIIRLFGIYFWFYPKIHRIGF